MATPTSACLSAAASLTPSPVMATILPRLNRTNRSRIKLPEILDGMSVTLSVCTPLESFHDGQFVQGLSTRPHLTKEINTKSIYCPNKWSRRQQQNEVTWTRPTKRSSISGGSKGEVPGLEGSQCNSAHSQQRPTTDPFMSTWILSLSEWSLLGRISREAATARAVGSWSLKSRTGEDDKRITSGQREYSAWTSNILVC